jgi:hypothetical protein
MTSRRKSKHTNSRRIDAPIPGVVAHQPERPLSVLRDEEETWY